MIVSSAIFSLPLFTFGFVLHIAKVPKDEVELLDAIIEKRLAAQGETLIDAERIDRLRQAVSDFNDTLRGLGD